MSPEHAHFTALAERVGPRVLAYLVRRCDQPADAADLVSEVFLVAWRRRGDLPEAADDAVGWLFGIARGVLANHHRGQLRRSALTERLREHIVLTGATHTAPDGSVEVRAALGRLRPQDREVLTLTAWDGLSAEQIAAALGITAAAVRQRLARARQRLREELKVRVP